MRAFSVLGSLGLTLAFPLALSAQDLASFEKRTTVKVLDNGLTAIVCERHEAPVVSFFTHVDAGADREVPGITGLAHMFEHMAFKGTDRIGTKDAAAEKAALEQVEGAYRAYDTERRRPGKKDEQKLAALEKQWQDAIAAADAYVVPNVFGEIVEREGGSGLNAFTSSDETGYIYSFPVNRLELWAHLESERFLHPVMREFYKERDVVTEERRLRTESQPVGRLIEQFTAAAFTAHPYGQPVIGWPSDLSAFSATDAQEFFARYYVPANMVVAVVGDVTPAQVLPVIEKYFGRLPKRPKPEPLRTSEPEQQSERVVVLQDPSQPFYVEGYHRPATGHPDDGEAIGAIRRHGDVKNRIPQIEDFHELFSQRNPGRKDHDPRDVVADPELFFGTEHSLGDLVPDSRTADLEIARECHPNERQGDAIADADVPGAADDRINRIPRGDLTKQ